MNSLEQLATQLRNRFSDKINQLEIKDCVTIEIDRENLLNICQNLRDESLFGFNQLIDVCGVDYQDYGKSYWRTLSPTHSGFSRGVEEEGKQVIPWEKPRFAAVYHLLSLTHNWRLRIKVFLGEADLNVPSIVDIWPAANWFEREAFDLFGIVFTGHPDLRRILTDYGFIGHPFRKDFPLIGEVELRYDATLERCVYEPVSIQPRTLVPKVIREDNRYQESETEEGDAHA